MVCCLIPGAGLRPLLFPRMLRRLAVWRTAAAAGRERPGARSADRCEAASRQAERLLDDFGDSILRLAYSYLHSIEDAEEVLQDTLLQFLRTAPDLQSPAHEKAWLLRVAANLSKNRLSYWRRHPQEELSDLLPAENEDPRLEEVWDSVKALPPKYRVVVHLYYYEQYTTVEIARLLGKKESTVRSLLARARGLLRENWEGDDFGE